jgi:hypothetical protein
MVNALAFMFSLKSSRVTHVTAPWWFCLIWYLRVVLTEPKVSMKVDSKLLSELRKRELELRLLIRQMRLDQLHNSVVCKNLETELHHVQSQLLTVDKKA